MSWTVFADLTSLVSAMWRRTKKDISMAEKKNVYYFIVDHLSSEAVGVNERLSRQRLPKPIATPIDVTIILETVFSTTIMCEMSTYRDTLQLAI